MAGIRTGQRVVACALAALCGGVCAPTVHAQGVRPSTSGRVVKFFDFEEKQTNPGEVPRYWFRAQDDTTVGRSRAGFPPWNAAMLTYTDEGGIAASGVGAVKLPTDGGSTSLMLESGVIPVFSQADYYVSAKVRTTDLKFAGARLVARYLDRTGKPIEGSLRSSEIVRSDNWSEIGLELPGDFPGAADIQLELCLLQPEQNGVPHAAREVFHQDVNGAAWFDDVAVVQLPRVDLGTSAPLNVSSSAQPPEMLATVRDLTGEELRVRIDIVDVHQRVVASYESPSRGGAIEVKWRPSLDRYGWYRARMDILAPAGRVGGSHVDFVWLPEHAVPQLLTDSTSRTASAISRDRARFGVVLREMPRRGLDDLPEMLGAVGTGRVTLPLWAENETPIAPAELVPLVDELLTSWQDITFSLDRVPPALSLLTHVPTDDPWTVLTGDNGAWMPYLGSVFDRYGQRVRRWQIGQVGDDRGFWRPNVGADLGTLERSLSRLVSGPRLAIPTRLDRAWSLSPLAQRTDPVTLLALVTPEMSEQAVGEAVKSFIAESKGLEGIPELSIALDMFPQQRYGLSAGPSELVKRAVEAWAASSLNGATSEPVLSLVQPWTFVRGAREQLMPRPEIAAWSNLIARLSDRRVVGAFPVTDGVACYILAPADGAPAERGGALVAWNRSAVPSEAAIEAYLGDETLRVLDLYGNSSPALAAPSVAGRRPGVRIPVGDEPIFIEGVDVELCRFISSFRVDPPFIESTNNQHERSLIIQNPWPVAISGKISILEPGGFDVARNQRDRNWRISPRSIPFSVDPRGTVSEPFSIAFSPTEEQGSRPFVVNIELVADKQYGTLTIRRAINIGLTTANIELSYSIRGENGSDLIVEAAISNTGAESLMMELTCFAPDLPRVKSMVADLVPGRQSVKRFVFTGQANNLRGKRIIVSAVTPEGGARLNKSVLIQ